MINEIKTKFLALSEEDQMAIISELVIGRKEFVELLEERSTQIDIWVRKGTISPVFRGVYLKSTVEKVLHRHFSVNNELLIEVRDLTVMLKSLQESIQRDFVKSVCMDRKQAMAYLGTQEPTFKLWMQTGEIHSIKWGLFLSTSVRRLREEKNTKKTKYQQSEIKKLDISDKKEFCIQALKLAHQEMGSITKTKYIAWRRDNPQYPSIGIIIGIFNKWSTAVEKAGIVSSHFHEN